MDNVVPLRRPVRSPMPELEPLWRNVIGEQLRDERRRRSERIADVAGRAGVSAQYLSELERGRKEASSEILAALAGALDLSVCGLARRAVGRMSATTRLHGPVCLAA